MQVAKRVSSTAAAAAAAACRTYTLQVPARMMCMAAAETAHPVDPRKKIYSDLKRCVGACRVCAGCHFPLTPPLFLPPHRATQTMADAKAEHTAYLVAKIATFRPPFPAFDVGDAIELTVRAARQW